MEDKIAIWLPHIKDLVNIVFFGVTGTVSLLAYRSAKKTVLQPIKTEIFKEQIKEFSKALELFYGKDELQLREEYGIDKALMNNILMMVDQYAELFFDLKRVEEREFLKGATFIVSAESLEKNFSVADDYLEPEKKSTTDKPHNNTKHSIWMNYKTEMLYIPPEYINMKKEIDALINNPLIPEKLMVLLKEYQTIVLKNIKAIGEVLDEASKEMPIKYTNIDQFKKISFLWIHHAYLKKIEDLEPQAKKIIRYLREYYQTDKLLDSK